MQNMSTCPRTKTCGIMSVSFKFVIFLVLMYALLYSHDACIPKPYYGKHYFRMMINNNYLAIMCKGDTNVICQNDGSLLKMLLDSFAWSSTS